MVGKAPAKDLNPDNTGDTGERLAGAQENERDRDQDQVVMFACFLPDARPPVLAHKS